MFNNKIIVRISNANDIKYAKEIETSINEASNDSSTSILKRSIELIENKLCEGKAIIAITSKGSWVGFSYIHEWGNGKFVSNCALVVNPKFRKMGIAKKIKIKIVELSRQVYPNANLFGLTTSRAVMKINNLLGYMPVTYSEIADDEEFWACCSSCPNYEILQNKKRKNCLCTAMLLQLAKDTKN